MKQPYFNREQRIAIYYDTMIRAHLMFNLAVRKLMREIYKKDGWIAMKKAERIMVRLVNLKLLGRDAPKKWWQLF